MTDWILGVSNIRVAFTRGSWGKQEKTLSVAGKIIRVVEERQTDMTIQS